MGGIGRFKQRKNMVKQFMHFIKPVIIGCTSNQGRVNIILEIYTHSKRPVIYSCLLTPTLLIETGFSNFTTDFVFLLLLLFVYRRGGGGRTKLFGR